MDLTKLFEKIKTTGFDSEQINDGFYYRAIKKDEIRNLICETLSESKIFPLNANDITQGCGWIIKKGPFFGYRLIQYAEQRLYIYGVCWNQWFLTKKAAANEYLKRATGDVVIIILPSN